MISSAFGSESLNVAEIMVKIRNETVAGSIQEAMQRLSKSKTLKKSLFGLYLYSTASMC